MMRLVPRRTLSVSLFRRRLAATAALAALAGIGCRSTSSEASPEPARTGREPERSAVRVGANPGNVGAGTPLRAPEGRELAVFAGGCFWGTEDLFRHVPGVTATAVGYTGGKTARPTYEDVCTHTTGHAEAVLVEFEPAKLSYAELLRLFFDNHDSTTVNRQGPDVGDQYRSEVFTFGDAQASAAREAIARTEKELGAKVVTRVSPAGAFWKAEEYHQQYDEKSGTKSCPIRLPKKTT
jgi:methionine-S-sulfoxide reductase